MIEQKNEFGLTPRDMQTISCIFQKHEEVEQVKIFGSRAIGNFKPGNDIDLAVINEGVDEKLISKIKAEFEESSLPYKVDLINAPGLKHTELLEHISRVGVIFYQSK